MNRRTVPAIVALIVVLGVAVLLWWRSNPTENAQKTQTIASIIPLTGPAAEFGGYNREAAELFVEDYNNTHKGVRTLRHVFQDSKSTPKDGVSAAQAILLAERPLAMQVQLSGVSMAVAPIAATSNILLFTIAGSGGPKGLHKLAFRNYPAPEMTAEATADIFLSGNSDARVAIYRINDEFGVSVSAAFKRKLEEMKMRTVADETFEKEATDFRAGLTKVLRERPSAIYLIGFGNPLGRILVQLRQLGFKGEVIGGPEIGFADVLGVAQDAAEGVRYLDLAFDASSHEEPARSFVSRYQARFKRSPTAVSGVIYDGWSLILAAIDQSHSADPTRIADELTKVTDYPGVCGKLRVTSDRDVVYPLTARVIRNGKAIPVDSVSTQ